MSALDGAAPLDLVEAACVVAGRQGRIEYWSPGATALFGYDASEMATRNVADLVPPEFRARHWAGWGRAWKLNDLSTSPPIMIPVVCSDGAVRAFASHLVPITTPFGQLLAVAAVWEPRSDRDVGLRVLT